MEKLRKRTNVIPVMMTDDQESNLFKDFSRKFHSPHQTAQRTNHQNTIIDSLKDKRSQINIHERMVRFSKESTYWSFSNSFPSPFIQFFWKKKTSGGKTYLSNVLPNVSAILKGPSFVANRRFIITSLSGGKGNLFSFRTDCPKEGFFLEIFLLY